ncbi:antioxidant, putative [Vibrio cholerae]|nr:antioxidant, putative [Vibrio cholerae]
MIQIGQTLPDVQLSQRTSEGTLTHSVTTLFANKKVVRLEMDTGNFGGVRSQRYAMVIENNVVTLLNVEPPKTFELSKAETVLASL